MSGHLTRGHLPRALADAVGVLVVRSPAGLAGRSAVIGRGGLVVGRDASCDLVLDSPYVSRRHAWVGPTASGLEIEDQGSANGTRISGARVVGPTRLRVGDRMVLGDVEVELVEPDRPLLTPEQPRTTSPVEGPTAPMPTRPESRSDARPATAVPVAARTGPALALAVLGSVVGAVFTTRLGHAGEWGALAGAALVPVVSTTFTTRLAGERGGVRATAICVQRRGARHHGHGLHLHGDGDGETRARGRGGHDDVPVSSVMRGTGTSGSSTPTQGPTPVEPTVEAEVHVDCAVAAGTCVATVASVGEEALEVTSVVTADEVFVPVVDPTEPSGPTEPWTVAADECLGAFLEQGQSCQVVAVADPGTVGPGTHQATLLVEHTGVDSPATAPLLVETT